MKNTRMCCRLILVPLAVIGFLTLPAAADPTIFSESNGGDLSALYPLATFDFDIGINSISGICGTEDPDFFDSFSFTIPNNATLISAQLTLADAGGSVDSAAWDLFSEPGYVYLEMILSLSPGSSQLNSVPLGPGLYDMLGGSMTLDTSTQSMTAYTFTFNVQVNVPEPPVLDCQGFMPPFDRPLALKKNAKRAIPANIMLSDESSFSISDEDIVAPPVINVLFNGQVFGEIPPDTGDLMPTGSSNEDNIFRFDPDSGQWIYNLGTKQFAAAGTYTVIITSGDENEYTISPGTCTQTFERLP